MDLAIAYLFTAVFGLSVMLIANRVFHSAGVAISDREAVSRMAGQLAGIVGPAGFYIYSIGFWAAVLASLIGVWQSISTLFADCHSLLRRIPQAERDAAMHPSSWQYRAALAIEGTYGKAVANLQRVETVKQDPSITPVDLAERSKLFQEEILKW